MRRFRALKITEGFIAQAVAFSAFIMVAVVVSGVAHPVKAGQRQMRAHDAACQTASCRPSGL